jgi:hypothetical protein
MTQKYILRKACAGLLPSRALAVGKSFNRLKHDLELTGVLDAMADDLLSPSAVAARGLFEPSYVAALRHRARSQPYGRERIYRLWSLLLTELWSRHYLDGRGAALKAPRPDLPNSHGPANAGHTNPYVARTGTANA